jgi:membrane-associated phospholipid phosphatase
MIIPKTGKKTLFGCWQLIWTQWIESALLRKSEKPGNMFRKGWMTILVLGIGFTALSQQPDTLIKKLDSLSKKTDTTGGQVNNTKPSSYNANTRITFPVYFYLLGSDIKQAFTKPFHMKKRDWAYLGIFTAGTVALSFADQPIQHYALKQRNRSSSLRNVSRYVTNFGGTYEVYTLAALGAYGFIFKVDKVKTTTLLATHAYITAGLVESVVKTLTGRQRPYNSDPNAVQAKPTFRGPLYKMTRDANGKKLNSSFPSGHTTVAFAAATVFAMEYKNHPIIPIITYSAATLIGLSRIAENKHWATDVLVGAALGYLTGRQVVNNYHRYAELKSPDLKKSTLRFNLNYEFGHVMPGLVYSF